MRFTPRTQCGVDHFLGPQEDKKTKKTEGRKVPEIAARNQQARSSLTAIEIKFSTSRAVVGEQNLTYRYRSEKNRQTKLGKLINELNLVAYNILNCI